MDRFVMSNIDTGELSQAIGDYILEKLKPIIADMLEPDHLMTVDQAADFLQTSKGQVYQWVNLSAHGLNDFPYMKSGRLLRFSKKELLSWMKKNSRR